MGSDELATALDVTSYSMRATNGLRTPSYTCTLDVENDDDDDDEEEVRRSFRSYLTIRGGFSSPPSMSMFPSHRRPSSSSSSPGMRTSYPLLLLRPLLPRPPGG